MRFSERASAELGEIYAYSLVNWGLNKAEAYIAGINAVADAVEQGRRPLKSRADLPGEPRYARAGRHFLFFASDDAGLFVARLIHEQMDIASHLR